MKYYYSKQVEHSHEITEFLSKNQIDIKDIVQIYANQYFHYVIFISDEKYFYEK